jgi:hypothetical protein
MENQKVVIMLHFSDFPQNYRRIIASFFGIIGIEQINSTIDLFKLASTLGVF